MNGPSPNSSGKNFPLHLPKVGGGQAIRPRHINKLAEFAGRSEINLGAGYHLSKSSGGTTLHIHKTQGRQHPWMCQSSVDGYMDINCGNFFMTSSSKVLLSGSSGGLSQYTPSVNGNSWMSNSSVSWAGDIAYAPESDSGGLHMRGAEVWFALGDTQYISTQWIVDGSNPLRTEKTAGLYYIEMDKWDGTQLDNPEADAKITEMNTVSENAKGRYVPMLKWASLTDMFNINRLVYPICTVDEYGNILQGVSSDIFHHAQDAPPFTVYCEKSDTKAEYKVNLVVGTVCNVVPTYDDGETYLWGDSPMVISEEDLKTKIGYVVLKVEPKAQDEFSGGRFPDAVTAQVLTDYDPATFDKDDAGYLLLALIRGLKTTDPKTKEDTVTGVEVLQVVTGSVWAERRKYSDNPATYFFYRLSTS